MEADEPKEVWGEAEVWLCRNLKGRNAARNPSKNYQMPWRHVLEEIPSRQEGLSGSFEVYTTRGV